MPLRRPFPAAAAGRKRCLDGVMGSCQDIGQSLRRSPPPRRKPCGHNATPPDVPRCRRRAQTVLGGRRGPASPRQRNAHAARLLPQLPIAEILPGRSRGVLCPDMTPSASSARGWFSRASGRVRPDPLPQTTLALPPMPYRPSPAVGWQAAKPDPPGLASFFAPWVSFLANLRLRRARHQRPEALRRLIPVQP